MFREKKSGINASPSRNFAWAVTSGDSRPGCFSNIRTRAHIVSRSSGARHASHQGFRKEPSTASGRKIRSLGTAYVDVTDRPALRDPQVVGDGVQFFAALTRLDVIPGVLRSCLPCWLTRRSVRDQNGDMRNTIQTFNLRHRKVRPKNGDMRNSWCTKGMTPFPCFDQREELRAPFSSFKVAGHAQAQTCYSSDD
jgi:hypothetical protein